MEVEVHDREVEKEEVDHRIEDEEQLDPGLLKEMEDEMVHTGATEEGIQEEFQSIWEKR